MSSSGFVIVWIWTEEAGYKKKKKTRNKETISSKKKGKKGVKKKKKKLRGENWITEPSDGRLSRTEG